MVTQLYHGSFQLKCVASDRDKAILWEAALDYQQAVGLLEKQLMYCDAIEVVERYRITKQVLRFKIN